MTARPIMDMSPCAAVRSVGCVDFEIAGSVLTTASNGPDYGVSWDNTDLCLYLLAFGELLDGDGGTGEAR